MARHQGRTHHGAMTALQCAWEFGCSNAVRERTSAGKKLNHLSIYNAFVHNLRYFEYVAACCSVTWTLNYIARLGKVRNGAVEAKFRSTIGASHCVPRRLRQQMPQHQCKQLVADSHLVALC